MLLFTSSAFHGYIIQHATSHLLALPVRESLCSFHSVAHFEESSELWVHFLFEEVAYGFCIKAWPLVRPHCLFVFEILSKISRGPIHADSPQTLDLNSEARSPCLSTEMIQWGGLLCCCHGCRVPKELYDDVFEGFQGGKQFFKTSLQEVIIWTSYDYNYAWNTCSAWQKVGIWVVMLTGDSFVTVVHAHKKVSFSFWFIL